VRALPHPPLPLPHTHAHALTLAGACRFDTACKTYAELVGNVCVDALSSSKYWHFVRLMGRAASNITLEVALQTAPTMALIGEEVAARHQNLASITDEIVHVVLDRAALGLHHGVVLVPGAMACSPPPPLPAHVPAPLLSVFATMQRA